MDSILFSRILCVVYSLDNASGCAILNIFFLLHQHDSILVYFVYYPVKEVQFTWVKSYEPRHSAPWLLKHLTKKYFKIFMGFTIRIYPRKYFEISFSTEKLYSIYCSLDTSQDYLGRESPLMAN